MLAGKNIILGVCGGIAAYKIASLVSSLVKQGASVYVLMTQNATNFITPITFETLTSHKCIVDTFDRGFSFEVEHIALAKKADMMLIAPATANVIGKIAHGIADDMLTTTVLALQCPVLIAPAMNTRMYENPIVQDNLKYLKTLGYIIIEPNYGYLACGDTGRGKMPEPNTLLEYLKYISYPKDLKGKKILVTAGPTKEAIDPVRFISNHSTGKMGMEIAKAAVYRGAEVTLILGNVALEKPELPNLQIIDIVSAKDMFEEVSQRFLDMDIVIKSAAVADFRPSYIAREKIKKKGENSSIPLERTMDILQYLGKHRKEKPFLCGFSMETENMLENSKDKLYRKNIDMIVANHLRQEGAGFGVDTNIVTIITKEQTLELEKMSKEKVGHKILDTIIQNL